MIFFYLNLYVNVLPGIEFFILETSLNMKNHKSLANFTLNNSLSIKQLTSPANKKTQGFDKTTLSSTFTSKIDKLKKKPKVDALEDQYVRGLQDEIKYLEMELKLLQEKDIQKHSQIDQLEKFFGDGIPINENILAIKNGFNNYKTINQKKLEQIANEKGERTNLIKSLSERVQNLFEELNLKEKERRGVEQVSSKNGFELASREAALKKKIEMEEEELKTVKLQNRKVFETIEKMTRNKLIENITLIKFENHKNNKLNALKETIGEKEEELLEQEKQLSRLIREESDKAYLIRLEEDNLSQKKKIIILERELDNHKNKIKEKQIELQQKLKERMTEIHAKMHIRNKLQDLKVAIDKANSLSVQDVTSFAKEKEVQEIKRVIDYNKKIAKYIDHYSKILSALESNIESMAQKKPQLKSEIEAYREELLRLKKRFIEEKERQVNIHAEMTEIQEKYNYCTAKLTPLQERIKKNNDKIEAYLGERHRLLEEIQVKEKQLELIFVLKGLNFEETEISKVSNNNLQSELVNFLKNWEKIQRNT